MESASDVAGSSLASISVGAGARAFLETDDLVGACPNGGAGARTFFHDDADSDDGDGGAGARAFRETDDRDRSVASLSNFTGIKRQVHGRQCSLVDHCILHHSLPLYYSCFYLI